MCFCILLQSSLYLVRLAEPIRTLGVCFGLMKSDPFRSSRSRDVTLHPPPPRFSNGTSSLFAAPQQTTCGRHPGATSLPRGHFQRENITWVGALSLHFFIGFSSVSTLVQDVGSLLVSLCGVDVWMRSSCSCGGVFLAA